jgi:flagellin
MALSILNNIPSLAAQNQLSITGSGLQKTLFRLSSGSRINSGADDAAGLAIADGLRANVSALTQSARNATDGIGKLQVADGALSQVTNLLNRAVTLATEAATGTIGGSQRTAIDTEYTAIKNEIDRIGGKTTFNGQTIFTSASSPDSNVFQSANGSAGTPLTGATLIVATETMTITDTKTGTTKTYTAAGGGIVDVNTLKAAIMSDAGTGAGKLDVTAGINAITGKFEVKDVAGDHSILVTSNMASLGAIAPGTQTGGNSSVFLSDGTSSALSETIITNIAELTSAVLSLKSSLTSDTTAKTALVEITTAIGTVAAQRGQIGADINRLDSASSVIKNQVQNLSAAEDGIRAADIAQEVANMTKFNILNQTGIAALSQANQMQQGVLSLLR